MIRGAGKPKIDQKVFRRKVQGSTDRQTKVPPARVYIHKNLGKNERRLALCGGSRDRGRQRRCRSSRRMAREPLRPKFCPSAPPKGSNSQEGGGMGQAAPAGTGMTAQWREWGVILTWVYVGRRKCALLVDSFV